MHHGRRLRNLVPASLRSLGEAESVGANHHAVLQEHVVADPAVLAHDGMRVREKIVADLHAAIDHDMRQQHGVRPDLDILVDHHVRPDVRVGVQSARWDARLLSDALRARSAAADGRVRAHGQRSGKDPSRAASRPE